MGLVLYRTFVPNFSLGTDYVVTVVAVLGTTITPYCFFWQSSQEAEDERVDPAAHTLLDAPEEAPAEIGRMRFDTYVGMGYSNVISLFIIVSTAATLNAHGITDIQTSAQAAEALRPIAGVFTFALFAAGIIGIGLLAVPVLAGSGAYALGEALGWTTGLDRKPLDAKAFYGTIAVSTLIGIGINFVGLDPIKALFWSAVINGVVAVPLMVIIMLMAMRRDVMGRFVLPRALWAMGWLCTGDDGGRGRDHVCDLVKGRTKLSSDWGIGWDAHQISDDDIGDGIPNGRLGSSSGTILGGSRKPDVGVWPERDPGRVCSSAPTHRAALLGACALDAGGDGRIAARNRRACRGGDGRGAAAVQRRSWRVSGNHGPLRRSIC